MRKRTARGNPAIAWVQLGFCVAAGVLVVIAADLAWGDIPRTADGKPDLSGFYDTATITPLQRRGDQEYLTEERAEPSTRSRRRRALPKVPRISPPTAKRRRWAAMGSAGAAGNVGGYDSFWVDPGEKNFKIDGKYRTSIVIDPPSGRIPAMTDEGQQRRALRFRRVRPRERRHRLVDGERHAGALRRPREQAAAGPLSARLRLHRRAADAADALQQPQAHRADPGPCDDPH